MVLISRLLRLSHSGLSLCISSLSINLHEKRTGKLGAVMRQVKTHSSKSYCFSFNVPPSPLWNSFLPLFLIPRDPYRTRPICRRLPLPGSRMYEKGKQGIVETLRWHAVCRRSPRRHCIEPRKNYAA